MTREDSDAIYAYLMSVPPVSQQNRPHELKFPFNQRDLLIGWRTLYFKEGEYQADKSKSVQWNRGAYLVEGLGHCAMCHTAINKLGGSKTSQEFEGGMIPNQNWYAPSLTSNREAGLGNWSLEGNHRPAAGRSFASGHRLRADGGSRLQQPAIPFRRGCRSDGGLSEGAAATRLRAAADRAVRGW